TPVGGIDALADAGFAPCAPVRVDGTLGVGVRALERDEDRPTLRLVRLRLDARLHAREPKGAWPDGRYERQDAPPPRPRARRRRLRIRTRRGRGRECPDAARTGDRHAG